MARAGAWLAVLEAAAVLLAWRTAWATVGMRPLTALCLIFLGASALLVAATEETKPIWLARGLATMGALGAFGSLLEYLTGVDTRFAALITTWVAGAGVPDPRMSPVTAVDSGWRELRCG